MQVMPVLFSAFGIAHRDCVTVVGSGGKSTLLRYFAKESSLYSWPTLVTTTTHIHLPFLGSDENVLRLQKFVPSEKLGLTAHSPLLVFSKYLHAHKVQGVPSDWVDRWFAQSLILVEGDGSRGIPFKIPNVWEPVIPSQTTHTIIMVGLPAMKKPLLSNWIHRLPLLYEMDEYPMSPIITPDLVARIIMNPRYYLAKIPAQSKISVYLANCSLNESFCMAKQVAQSLQKHGFRGLCYTGNLSDQRMWIQKISCP